MYIYISSSVIYRGASRENPKTYSGGIYPFMWIFENLKFRLGMSGIWHILQMLHRFLSGGSSQDHFGGFSHCFFNI